MEKHDRDQLAWETKRKHNMQRLKNGALSAVRSMGRLIALLCYLGAAAVIFAARGNIFALEDSALLPAPLYYGLVLPAVIIMLAGMGLYGLLLLFGSPMGGGSVNAGLLRAGLKNHAGETPLLLAKRKDKERPHLVVYEFEANGVPLSVWEDKQAHLESCLDVNIIKITQGKNKKRVLLHAVTAMTTLPDRVHWRPGYLTQKSFVLVLGQSLLGLAEVNLANIPHILLGGSTGSGKSVMLKLLLMQCVEKCAIVYLADFKGGVDFPPVWHQKCRMVFDEGKLLDVLGEIIDTLERRKEKLRAAGRPNIDTYNTDAATPMRRIVFACDEVAELLDKTGLGKDGKEQISKIEAKLAVIARQGRAFGIHLILATQRPDANILTGQIRNNITCRICGRADNVLSQIILDNTDASDRIPKDAQGRFLLQDGTLFQGYWFDDAGW